MKKLLWGWVFALGITSGAAQAEDLRRLDLLIVVDDSGSMTEYQNQLAARLPPLLSAFERQAWQVAVVTSTSSCLRDVIDWRDYLHSPIATQERFARAIQTGEDGASVEQTILSASEALYGSCGDITQPWRQRYAKTAVLIISDEKNCGSASNEGCSGEPYGSSRYFLDNHQDVRVYGLFHDDNEPNCSYYGWDTLGDYPWLTEETGGMWSSICVDDYTPFLEEISRNFASQ